MRCECRKEIEARLEEKVKGDLPAGYQDYRASLEGYALILSEPPEERMAVQYQGEVYVPKKDPSKGNKRQKISVNMLATYCPFCGKPAKATDHA